MPVTGPIRALFTTYSIVRYARMGSTNHHSWRAWVRNAQFSSEHTVKWREKKKMPAHQAGIWGGGAGTYRGITPKPISLAPCFFKPNIGRLQYESSCYFSDPQRVYPTLSRRTGLERRNVTQQVFSATLRY